MVEDKDPNILLDVLDPFSGQSILGFNQSYKEKALTFCFPRDSRIALIEGSHATCELDEDGVPLLLFITVSLKKTNEG